MKKLKLILIYYYGKKEPLLTNFINFYFLTNAHGGINNMKMIQNFEKANIKKTSHKNLDTENNLDESFEKKRFKYYIKGGKRNDAKIMAHMEKLEENLILQINDLHNRTLASLSEKLIKYIEKTKHMFALYAYFIFIRMNNYDLNEDDFYAFQKCLLLYGNDKNEGPVLEKIYLLR